MKKYCVVHMKGRFDNSEITLVEGPMSKKDAESIVSSFGQFGVSTKGSDKISGFWESRTVSKFKEVE
jgi:hypothetical protein